MFEFEFEFEFLLPKNTTTKTVRILFSLFSKAGNIEIFTKQQLNTDKLMYKSICKSMFGKRGPQNSNKMLIECGSLYIFTIQVEIQNYGDNTSK